MTQTLCHDLRMKRCDCPAAAFFELHATNHENGGASRVVQTRGPQTRVDLLRFSFGTHSTPYAGHVGWLKTVFVNTLTRSWCGAIHLSFLSSCASPPSVAAQPPGSLRSVLAAPAPRLQRASKHLRAPSSLGASAETACRRRRRARRPTPADSRYRGRSTPPRQCCPSKVCHLRPRRATSAPGGKCPAAQALMQTS